jgi:hypothetical protein
MSMDPLEAKQHMKRCVDSGLWVPADASMYDEPDENMFEKVEEN